jgi:hypothetical protein
MSQVPFTLARPTRTDLDAVVGDGLSWLVVVWLTKTRIECLPSWDSRIGFGPDERADGADQEPRRDELACLRVQHPLAAVSSHCSHTTSVSNRTRLYRSNRLATSTW